MCEISQNLINSGKAGMIARMLCNGLSYDEISYYTGISVNELKELNYIYSVECNCDCK